MISRRRFLGETAAALSGAAAAPHLAHLGSEGPPQTARRWVVIVAAAFLLFTEVAAGQDDQYKRFGLNAMAEIAAGNVDTAIADANRFLEAYPNDPEFYYVLSVAHATKGELDEAMDYARRAVEAGLPAGRLLAGPRAMLSPLHESDAFRAWIETLDGSTQIIQGPLLGGITSSRALVWVRTASVASVTLEVTREQEVVAQTTASTRAEDDFTTVLSVGDLEPQTQYSYSMTVNGVPHDDTWSFETLPAEGLPARFKIGFGGGAGYTPWHEDMWTTISEQDLAAFLMMGDNVYHDHPEQPDVQRYTYYRRQSRPEFRAFASETPLFAIWDDHDFAENDSWGGPESDEPAWKLDVLRLFKQNWANPSYGGGPAQPGVWFDFAVGDVHFFMLDGRYYRTDPKIEDPSMLGPAQKEWLFDRLRGSNATFKVIVSPVPWAPGAKGGTQMTPQGPQPGGLDTWDGFPDEREEIFDFLAELEIDGIVLLSADRHRSDAWRIERDQGYPLYEFESSQLTNVHTHELMEGALFGYNEKNSFGVLTFDTTQRDPTVTYDIMSIDGERVHSITVALSDLTGGR